MTKLSQDDASLASKNEDEAWLHNYLINRKRIFHPHSEVERDLRCSSLFKLLPNYKNIIFGHATWASFIALAPRTFKVYTLPSASAVEVETASYQVELRANYFSLSPGVLASLDDFYVISSPSASLAVLETTNDIYLPKVYARITPKSSLCWMRALTANAVATSGKSWTDTFAAFHSGTYPNQWQVLDMNLFQAGVRPGPDLFWVLEEIPGEVN